MIVEMVRVLKCERRTSLLEVTMRARIFLVAALLVCGVVLSLFLLKKPVAKQSIVSINRDTTRITKPLDQRGFVDYVAAVDEAARRGVTVENNYEVIVREVLGPIYGGDVQIAYYRKLGIPRPVQDDNHFVRYVTFALANDPNDTPGATINDNFSKLMASPWSAEDFPLAAEWLKEMDAHLNKLVEGSKRTRYYTPYDVAIKRDTNEDELPPMMSISLESALDQYVIAKALSVRSMYRIGRGDLNGAWSDLQAIRRISCHVAGGQFAIESEVGFTLDAFAIRGEQCLLKCELTEDQARRFLSDLERLPYLTPLAEKWDTSLRFTNLDAMQVVAHCTDQKTGKKLIHLMKSGKLLNTPSDASGIDEIVIDWDPAFKTVNQWFDRLVAASGEKTLVKQARLLEELQGDYDRLKTKYESGEGLRKVLENKNRSQALGMAMGEIQIVFLFPEFRAIQDSENLTAIRLDLIRLGFAVKVIQRKYARYPKALSELAPDFVKEIPLDPASGKSFIYRRTNQGAKIYSVGKNNKDDQGHASWDDDAAHEGADDITVRVSKP